MASCRTFGSFATSIGTPHDLESLIVVGIMFPLAILPVFAQHSAVAKAATNNAELLSPIGDALTLDAIRKMQKTVVTHVILLQHASADPLRAKIPDREKDRWK